MDKNCDCGLVERFKAKIAELEENLKDLTQIIRNPDCYNVMWGISVETDTPYFVLHYQEKTYCSEIKTIYIKEEE